MAEGKHAGEELLRKLTVRNAAPQEDEDGLTREHQTNVQAFSLTVVFKDRRRREAFPWSMYGGHDWTDDGDIETIAVLFGERGCIVRGYRFAALDRDLSLGKRASIREHTKAQVESMLAVEADEPIILSVETFPPFPQLLAEIKGEDDNENRPARHAQR
jgi:hypothetical protein